jgi:hypothetical protein
MGLDEVMPLLQVGSVSRGEVMKTLRLFGKYILPHFRAKAQSGVG